MEEKFVYVLASIDKNEIQKPMVFNSKDKAIKALRSKYDDLTKEWLDENGELIYDDERSDECPIDEHYIDLKNLNAYVQYYDEDYEDEFFVAFEIYKIKVE